MIIMQRWHAALRLTRWLSALPKRIDRWFDPPADAEEPTRLLPAELRRTVPANVPHDGPLMWWAYQRPDLTLRVTRFHLERDRGALYRAETNGTGLEGEQAIAVLHPFEADGAVEALAIAQSKLRPEARTN